MSNKCQYVSCPQESDAVNACLEVLNELVSKFGSQMVLEHENVKKALLSLLQNDKAAHRKRTLQCLGASLQSLSKALCNPEYTWLSEYLL